MDHIEVRGVRHCKILPPSTLKVLYVWNIRNSFFIEIEGI